MAGVMDWTGNDLMKVISHITPYADGDPLLKRSSSYSYSFPVVEQFCLLSAWSANGDGSAYFQGKFQGHLLNDDIYLGFCNCYRVILRTNRAKCTLNKEFFYLLNEESISRECNGRPSL